MKIRKYKLPCKADKIKIGVDYGDSINGDMTCKTLIAICGDKKIILESKII